MNKIRKLEIGPGNERLPGFETINIAPGPFTDHVGDAKKLPFVDNTFDVVYSSHCIEHMEWFEIESTICEWVRVLKPGGLLEVHTVDSTILMRSLLELEEGREATSTPGKWKCDLHKYDPYKWAVARIMNYRRGEGKYGHTWFHRSILTPNYMRRCFSEAGLVDIEKVDEPRGNKKHRGINMGLCGIKPI